MQWGGLVVGGVFLAIGLTSAAVMGWRITSTVFCIVGMLIVMGQLAWIFVARARRRATSSS